MVYNGDLESLQITGNEANILHYYKIFAYDTSFNYASGVELSGRRDADSDGDGLIEIYTAEMLHNIRYNLAGTSYKTSAGSVGNSSGCPASGCNGYELTQSLNFDKDGDGTTWSGDSTNGYTLDAGDNASPHFIVADGGWEPIGSSTNAAFNAIFEGNGHTITGLAISRNERDIGMFGSTGANAEIRNIGLNNNLADCTRASNNNYIGGLVGEQSGGSITGSYATGSVDGGDGSDFVGGLVGGQSGGSITGSYATGSVDGGDGDNDYIGGLVGEQFGSITASYATGSVDGGDGFDRAGGLVGLQQSGSITGSYATGAVDGGDGDNNYSIGGLVGQQFSGSITASYATGSVDGGDGADNAGGLVGYQNTSGSITA